MKKYLYRKDIFLNKSKSNRYIKDRIREKYEEMDKSIKILLKKINFRNKKILDIGCASGGMYKILKNKFGPIDYTGIDLDTKCIEIAKTRYSKAKFFSTNFFSKEFKENTYDIVMLWGWAHMYPDWKKLFSKIIKISKGFILFDNRIRLNGPTVIDLDLSYQYYYKTIP